MWIIICGAGLLLSALILLISGKTKLPAACRCPGIGGLFQKAAYRLLFYFGKQGKPSADAVNRLSLCLLLLNVFNMLAFSAAVYGRLHPAVSNGRIERGDYFSGEKELTVSEEEFGTFQVNVQPRRYTEEATRELARKLKRCLPEKMRGENPSLQEVSKNLILPRQVEGYPFEITWDSSDYERMDDSGRIRNPGAGELRLTAHFFYEEFQDSAQFSVQRKNPRKKQQEMQLRTQSGKVKRGTPPVLICSSRIVREIFRCTGKSRPESRVRKYSGQGCFAVLPFVFCTTAGAEATTAGAEARSRQETGS